jgi:hypothetical protein
MPNDKHARLPEGLPSAKESGVLGRQNLASSRKRGISKKNYLQTKEFTQLKSDRATRTG